MIPRVLEPESMDTTDEANDYDLMDHSGVNARFVDDFLMAHGPCRGGEILDVGTGTARIPIALCQADPRARVLGIDLAESMLELARRNVSSAGLSDRIQMRLVDAKAMGIAELYEGVISNTIIHHIPDPSTALAAIAKRVAPGGTLMVRDLYRPDDLATLNALVSRHAGEESPAARALFKASLHAALTLQEIRDIVASLDLPPDGVRMTSDRHWTWVWHRG